MTEARIHLHPSGATALPTAVTPVERILGRFDREKLAAFVTVAVDLLDVIDGDADLEDDAEDCCSAGDDRIEGESSPWAHDHDDDEDDDPGGGNADDVGEPDLSDDAPDFPSPSSNDCLELRRARSRARQLRRKRELN